MIGVSIVTWASLRSCGLCTVTEGLDTRCGTDEFSDGTGRQSQMVWRWRAQADCSRHEQRRLEKCGYACDLCVTVVPMRDQGRWMVVVLTLEVPCWTVVSERSGWFVCYCSAYQRSGPVDGGGSDTGSALLNSSGIRAVWMLMLALLFKMAATIFTYGIKVITVEHGAMI